MGNGAGMICKCIDPCQSICDKNQSFKLSDHEDSLNGINSKKVNHSNTNTNKEKKIKNKSTNNMRKKAIYELLGYYKKANCDKSLKFKMSPFKPLIKPKIIQMNGRVLLNKMDN